MSDYIKPEETKSDASSSTFRFLDLPFEMRTDVYNLLLPQLTRTTFFIDTYPSSRPARLSSILSCQPYDQKQPDHSSSVIPNLLSSCATIRNEATPVFYSAINFGFQGVDQWFTAEIFFTRLSKLAREAIRKIIFDFPSRMQVDSCREYSLASLVFNTETNRFAGNEGYAMEVAAGFISCLPALEVLLFSVNRDMSEMDFDLVQYLNKWKGRGKIILDIQGKSTTYRGRISEYGRKTWDIVVPRSVIRKLRDSDWMINGMCDDEDQELNEWRSATVDHHD